MKELSARAGWLSPSIRWLLWLATLAVSTLVLVGPSLALALRRQIDTGENAQLDYNLYLLSKIFHVSEGCCWCCCRLTRQGPSSCSSSCPRARGRGTTWGLITWDCCWE
jgi:uncharacterized membrane protein YhaH (DUF805 family)